MKSQRQRLDVSYSLLPYLRSVFKNEAFSIGVAHTLYSTFPSASLLLSNKHVLDSQPILRSNQLLHFVFADPSEVFDVLVLCDA